CTPGPATDYGRGPLVQQYAAPIIAALEDVSKGSRMDDTSRSVGIIMGSQSDWDTMQHAANTLEQLGIGYETRIVSAHRTPDRLYDYAHTAKSRGLRLIIAGAGGAAHLPGLAAALTRPPALGVPIESRTLKRVYRL